MQRVWPARAPFRLSFFAGSDDAHSDPLSPALPCSMPVRVEVSKCYPANPAFFTAQRGDPSGNWVGPGWGTPESRDVLERGPRTLILSDSEASENKISEFSLLVPVTQDSDCGPQMLHQQFSSAGAQLVVRPTGAPVRR